MADDLRAEAQWHVDHGVRYPGDVVQPDAILALLDALDRYKRLEAAARELASNSVDDVDSRLRYVYIQPDRAEWQEFTAALLALEEP